MLKFVAGVVEAAVSDKVIGAPAVATSDTGGDVTDVPVPIVVTEVAPVTARINWSVLLTRPPPAVLMVLFKLILGFGVLVKVQVISSSATGVILTLVTLELPGKLELSVYPAVPDKALVHVKRVS